MSKHAALLGGWLPSNRSLLKGSYITESLMFPQTSPLNPWNFLVRKVLDTWIKLDAERRRAFFAAERVEERKKAQNMVKTFR